MSRFLRGLEINRGERLITALMALIYFLLLMSYYFLKPARDSLFLVNVSPEKLPFVFILVALIASPVASVQAQLNRRFSPGKSSSLTLLALAASLIGLRFLTGLNQTWIFYLFYAWVGIIGALTTSQFWLLANVVYDATQAKRIFSVLAAGGILGAMCGGEVTRLLMTRVGIQVADLMPLAAALLVIVMLLGVVVQRKMVQKAGRTAVPVVRKEVDPDPPGRSIQNMIRSIHRSKHLRLTVGIMATGVIVTSIADFQFKSIAFAITDDPVDLTAFLGRFYGLTSLLSLVVQLLLANRLIRWAGVGGTLLTLPLILTLGAGAFFVLPGLITVTMLRGSDLSLKHSLDRTSRELLFLPVPQALKQRVKVFIDLLMDRWFRGLAGVLLLVLTMIPGMSVRLLTVPLLLMLVLWVVLASRMRREYVNSFRQALERREVDLDDLRRGINDKQTAGAILDAIRGGNVKQILYAMELAGALDSEQLVPLLGDLLEHRVPDIRRRALKVLRQCGDDTLIDTVRPMLKDTALDVRRAAIEYLDHASQASSQEMFTACLDDDDARVRAVALAWLADHDPELANRIVTERVMKDALANAEPQGAELRKAATKMLGVWDHDDASEQLQLMLEDDDENIIGEALRSTGRRGDIALIPDMLSRLSDRRLRVHARSALSLLGERAVPTLAAVAQSDDRDPVWRRQVVAALGEIRQQTCVDHLIDLVEDGTPMIRRTAMTSLLKIRESQADLDFRTKRIRALQLVSMKTWYGSFQCRRWLRKRPEAPATRLLLRTLDEKMEYRLIEFMELLALCHPFRDVRNTYLGLRSNLKHQRANAVEYLDNILEGVIRDAVSPIALRQPGRVISQTGRELFELSLDSENKVSEWLTTQNDPWLRACAAHEFGKGGESLLTVIEKVILLQDVDVFQQVPSDEISALALIATEKSCLQDDVIYREGEEADALYLVLSGAVKLHRGDHVIAEAPRGQAFGTWALLDDEPRLTSATAAENASLLKINKDDFTDLLADNVQIARGVIRTIAHRMRSLAEGQLQDSRE
jgi:ATP:ADP antiporter, AAA family